MYQQEMVLKSLRQCCRQSYFTSDSCNEFTHGSNLNETDEKIGLSVRKPLMTQSELFEQWKLSLTDAVASEQCLDQVNKREQTVADQDIQFLEEEMQDVSVMAGQRMFTDVDMPQWWQTDPLLDVTDIRPVEGIIADWPYVIVLPYLRCLIGEIHIIITFARIINTETKVGCSTPF